MDPNTTWSQFPEIEKKLKINIKSYFCNDFTDASKTTFELTADVWKISIGKTWFVKVKTVCDSKRKNGIVTVDWPNDKLNSFTVFF